MIWIRLLFVCALAAACDTTDDPLPADAIVVAFETAPTALDPRFATDETSSLLADLLYRGLTRTTANGDTVLDLATSLDVTDGTRYAFRLQPDVTFHDGTRFTSADVRATYESVLRPETASPKREGLTIIDTIETPDDLTVVFTLRTPFAPFLDATGLGILPVELLAASREPVTVGCGPFRLVRFRPDRDVLLASTRDGREASHILFKIVPDDTVRALEMQHGTIHLAQNAIDPDMLPWLGRQAGVEISSVPGTTFHYLGLNLRDPHLGNASVRQAIALAIDRDAVIRYLLKGHASAASGLLAPGHWAFTGDVPLHPYDPERARALLDAAGFPDPDGPGPEPRFRLLYKGSLLQKRRRFAEVLQEQLARIGIALDIRTYEWGTLYADIRRGNFQIYALAWVGVSDPDIYYSLFHSTMTPPRGNNRGGYVDTEIDRLTTLGRTTADRQARREAYVEIQRRLGETLPIIPLWWAPTVVARSTRLRGFVPQPNGSLLSLADARLELQ